MLISILIICLACVIGFVVALENQAESLGGEEAAKDRHWRSELEGLAQRNGFDQDWIKRHQDNRPQ